MLFNSLINFVRTVSKASTSRIGRKIKTHHATHDRFRLLTRKQSKEHWEPKKCKSHYLQEPGPPRPPSTQNTALVARIESQPIDSKNRYYQPVFEYRSAGHTHNYAKNTCGNRRRNRKLKYTTPKVTSLLQSLSTLGRRN